MASSQPITKISQHRCRSDGKQPQSQPLFEFARESCLPRSAADFGCQVIHNHFLNESHSVIHAL